MHLELASSGRKPRCNSAKISYALLLFVGALTSRVLPSIVNHCVASRFAEVPDNPSSFSQFIRRNIQVLKFSHALSPFGWLEVA